MDKVSGTSRSCVETMKLLGDYWILRIIDTLKSGETRFCELQRHIDNLNPATLTNRLKRLEEARLIIRSEETKDKISVTYCLTELGEEVLPVIKALDRFSAKAKTIGNV